MIRSVVPFVVLFFVLLLNPGIVNGCEQNVGPWEWNRCWSFLRIMLWLGTCAIAWWVSMELYFPMLLEYVPGRVSWLRGILGLITFLFIANLFFSLVFSYFGFTYGWRAVTHLTADGRPVTITVWHENIEWSAVIGILWFSLLAFSVPVLFLSRSVGSPWPKAAFAWSLGIFIFMVLGAFDLFFGSLGAELRYSTSRFFPASWVWFNIHWPWLSILVIGLFLSVVFHFIFSGKRETSF